MDTRNTTIARRAAVVGSATLLSRILGFVRDMLIAFALGAGPLADAFFVAFRLPNLLRRLLGEGSLTLAFIPVFTRTRKESGDGEAFCMARSILVWLWCILGVVTCCVLLFAHELVFLVAPGFVHDAALFATTAQLVRICFPYALFVCSIALFMGILNARNHFLVPALIPCVLNLCLIAGACLAVVFELSAAYTLAWSVLIAGILQYLLELPVLGRVGFSLAGPVVLLHPGVKKTAHLMIPTLFGSAVYQISIVLGTVMASTLPSGSVAFLYYADRLVQFPLGIFAVAIGTAALPSLAHLATQDNLSNFSATLNASLRLTLFISLPAAAGLMALAEPVIAILFGRGAFSPEAVSATGQALMGYAVGLPAFAGVRPLISAYSALQDTRTPAVIAGICLLVYAVSGFVLMDMFAHTGLALAVSLSSYLNMLLLLWRLDKQLGKWKDFFSQSLLYGLLSLAMGCGVFYTQVLGMWAVALIPFWVLGYGAVAVLLKIPEALLLYNGIKKLLRTK